MINFDVTQGCKVCVYYLAFIYQINWSIEMYWLKIQATSLLLYCILNSVSTVMEFLWFDGSNSIMLLRLSRFAVRNVFPSGSYFFSKFLRARILCWKKVVQVRGRRPRICDLFETLFLLERTGKTSNKHLKKTLSMIQI